MRTRKEIIEFYLKDLNNIVPQSPARDNRINMLEKELAIDETICSYSDDSYIKCPDWKLFPNGCSNCHRYDLNKI
jgi:hypothetical protein